MKCKTCPNFVIDVLHPHFGWCNNPENRIPPSKAFSNGTMPSTGTNHDCHLERKEKIMRTKHTPGPWKYGQTLNQGLAVWSSPSIGEPDYVIAMHHGSGDKAYADVRLIAAAPDMLNALKRAVEFFYGVQGVYSDMAHDLLEVIKKAEGDEI